MLERDIEKGVSNYAKVFGWITFKFVSPNNRGVPDRVFIKAGRVVFIEFKRVTGKLTPLQTIQIRKMRDSGAEVYVCYSLCDGKLLFDGFENAKQG